MHPFLDVGLKLQKPPECNCSAVLQVRSFGISKHTLVFEKSRMDEGGVQLNSYK